MKIVGPLYGEKLNKFTVILLPVNRHSILLDTKSSTLQCRFSCRHNWRKHFMHRNNENDKHQNFAQFTNQTI